MQKSGSFERFRSIVENTAKANGAEAILTINEGYPITYNDPDLVDLMDDTYASCRSGQSRQFNTCRYRS